MIDDDHWRLSLPSRLLVRLTHSETYDVSDILIQTQQKASTPQIQQWSHSAQQSLKAATPPNANHANLWALKSF